jgi:carbamate kinase
VLAVESAGDPALSRPYPFDVLGAQTQGMDGYGTPRARPIRRATTEELRARPFPAGSMSPKVEAVCRFVEKTGGMAAIGRLQDAAALLAGTAGTIVCA